MEQQMNMEQVLGLVLELETQAKEIVRTATDRREALPDEVDKKLSEMRERYTKGADKRIEAIRAEEAAHLTEELNGVRETHASQMKRLTDAADSELERWAELIFRNSVDTGTEKDL